MKKINYSLIFLLSSLLLAACNNSKGKDSGTDMKEVKKEIKIIKKSYPVHSSFNCITNVGGIDLIYTPGECSIVCEGDSSIANNLEVDIDSELLTINVKSEKNQDINIYEGKLNLKVYISAPTLKIISLCSSGDFIADHLVSEEPIQLGSMGSGSFKIKELETKSIKFELTPSSTTHSVFDNIKAEKVEVYNFGEGTVNLNVDCDEIIATSTRKDNIIITGKYKTKDVYGVVDKLIRE